jgi:hypothetical protein
MFWLMAKSVSNSLNGFGIEIFLSWNIFRYIKEGSKRIAYEGEKLRASVLQIVSPEVSSRPNVPEVE